MTSAEPYIHEVVDPATEEVIAKVEFAGVSVARGVESGNLSVNSHSSVRCSTPFGGFKRSGLGREPGPDALDVFTETENVFISTAGNNS